MRTRSPQTTSSRRRGVARHGRLWPALLGAALLAPFLVAVPASAQETSEPHEVVRVSAASPVDRAVAWSQLARPDGGAPPLADVVLLGRDDVFADSLASGGAQGALDAPLLLTGRDVLDPRAAAELTRLGARRVALLGGVAALAPAVESALRAAGYVVERWAGPTRIETAVSIGKAVLPNATTAVLVRAEGDGVDPTRAFADALAAGGLAAELRAPVLLTATSGLSPATAAYLASAQVRTVLVVGGTGAVAPTVADQVTALGITVTRLRGFDRAATAAAVAQYRTELPGATVRQSAAHGAILVNGTDPEGWTDAFPAALTSGERPAPILLVDGDRVPDSTLGALGAVTGTVVCGATTSAEACDTATGGGPDVGADEAPTSPSPSPAPSPAATPPANGGGGGTGSGGSTGGGGGGGGGGGSGGAPTGATFKLSQTSATLTEAAQSVEVRLIGTLAGGGPAQVPAGLTWDVAGDEDAVTVTDLGGGRFRLTATDVVGSLVLGLRVPGQPLAEGILVVNARLADGVVGVADEDVVFPALHGTTFREVDEAALLAAEHPFTRAELAARLLVEVPREGELDLLAPRGRLPWVLRGPAPETGSILLGTGSSELLGRVVETDELPTLERDGFVLVTLELVPLGQVYTDVKYEVPHADLTDLRVIPSGYTVQYECPDDVPVADCPDPNAAPVLLEVDDEIVTDAKRTGAAADAVRGSGAAALRQVEPIPDFELPPEAEDGLCTGAFDAKALTLRPPATTFTFKPFIEPHIVFTGLEVHRMRLAAGWNVSAAVTAGGTIEPTATISVKCVLALLRAVEFPMVGPAAPFVSVYADAFQLFNASVTVAGGMKFDVSLNCTATHIARFGFDYAGGPYTAITSPPSPPPTCLPPLSGILPTSADTIPLRLEVSFGPAVEIPVGIRLGGEAARIIGQWIGDANFGRLQLVKLSIKASPTLKWENRAQALIARTAASFAGIVAQLKGEVDMTGPQWFVDLVLGNSSNNRGVFTLPAVSLTVEIPVASVYRALTPLNVEVHVDDRQSSPHLITDPVTAAVDEQVRVRGIMQYAPSGIVVTDADPTGGTVWLNRGSDQFPDLQPLSGWTVADGASGDFPDVVASGRMTRALCTEVGETGKRVLVAAETDMFGLIPTPGIAASFLLRCVPREFELIGDQGTPDVVRLDQVEARSAVMSVRGRGLLGVHYELVTSSLPSWLRFDGPLPASNFTTNDETDQRGTLHLECGTRRGSLTATFSAQTTRDRPRPALTDTVTVQAECADHWGRFVPRTTSGGAVTVDTYGGTPRTWRIDARGLPEWATVSYGGATNALFERAHTPTPLRDTQTLSVSIAPQGAACDPPPAQSAHLTLRTTFVTPQGDDTVTDVLTLTRPAGTRRTDCDRPAHSWGDPHVRSFDGWSYDAQTVGEYIYVQPRAGADAPTVHVRHELTNPDDLRFAQPTSITAVAIGFHGRVVEVYSRPSEVRVDGATVVLTPDQPLQVGDLTVVRSGDRTTITGGGATFAVREYGILDLFVTMRSGAPVVGLLGTPNDDANDDAVPRGATTGFSLAQLHAHGSELEAFTESWRIGTRGASLLTRDYDGLLDDNPPYNPAAIEPFRQRVRDALGRLADLCATGDGGAGSQTVDALALELAIGRSDTDLGAYSCAYQVLGTASADGTPQPGLPVELDAPGLSPCRTVTGGDGRFMCSLTPDIAELQALAESSASPTAPFVVTVVGRWESSDDHPAGTGSATFSERAPLGGTVRAVGDVAVDVSTVPTLVISGTALDEGGLPLSEPFGVEVVGYDAAGAATSTRTFDAVASNGDGSYSVQASLPRGTVRARLTALAAPAAERVPLDVADVRTGLQPVSHDVRLRPPTVTFDPRAGRTLTAGQQVNITVATAAPERAFPPDGEIVVSGTCLGDAELRVPAGAGVWTVTATSPLPDDCAIDAAVPLRDGSTLSSTATYPGGTIAGTVRSATTGTPISGATVTLDDGSTATTGADGRFQILDVPTGQRTVSARAPFHAETQTNVTVQPRTTTTVDLPLSANLAEGELRIVVTWAANPRDLDSHLWLPASQPYHVYYGDDGRLDGCPYAQLDIDDTNGFGPETITVSQAVPGTYRYVVHNFSGSPGFPEAGAIVRLFDDSGLVQEFTPPSTGTASQRVWHVFDIDATTGLLTTVNTLATDLAAVRPYSTPSTCAAAG